MWLCPLLPWVNNWLESWAQNVVVNGVTSAILLNVFITDLDAGVECMLRRFAVDTKIRRRS